MRYFIDAFVDFNLLNFSTYVPCVSVIVANSVGLYHFRTLVHKNPCGVLAMVPMVGTVVSWCLRSFSIGKWIHRVSD